MTLPDYYEILQVSPRAELDVIQAAYSRLATKFTLIEISGTNPPIK